MVTEYEFSVRCKVTDAPPDYGKHLLYIVDKEMKHALGPDTTSDLIGVVPTGESHFEPARGGMPYDGPNLNGHNLSEEESPPQG
jgi:hypothetical protein